MGKILLLSFDDDEKEVIKSVLSVLKTSSQNFKTERIDYQTIIEYGELVVALDKREVRKKDAIISLTFTEFEILQLLICNPGIVFSKEQIYDIIWKECYGGDYSIVTTHIHHIRGKIEENPTKPIYIQTVWGVGYRFNSKCNSK